MTYGKTYETSHKKAINLLESIKTVEVKRGIGTYAALCHPPQKCRSLIYKGAKKALSRKDEWRAFNLLDPVELNVRFATASGADRTLRIPGVERADNLTVRFKDKDFIEAFRAFYTMADLVDLVPYF